uniref:Salivary secreted protein n=1 Tax=Mayetiola destructor TaxID=39758 RepID=Q6W015_MAYDE|nr:salivary secreted protein [Mayetiola destructor]
MKIFFWLLVILVVVQTLMAMPDEGESEITEEEPLLRTASTLTRFDSTISELAPNSPDLARLESAVSEVSRSFSELAKTMPNSPGLSRFESTVSELARTTSALVRSSSTRSGTTPAETSEPTPQTSSECACKGLKPLSAGKKLCICDACFRARNERGIPHPDSDNGADTTGEASTNAVEEHPCDCRKKKKLRTLTSTEMSCKCIGCRIKRAKRGLQRVKKADENEIEEEIEKK